MEQMEQAMKEALAKVLAESDLVAGDTVADIQAEAFSISIEHHAGRVVVEMKLTATMEGEE